ncbi:hypothetical protein ACFFGT_00090 [Mucilaginibacter angelicae]|uniref:MG2 domain-containing protein n=1 Tax=Mucilaginibacter angelicae TaxID=869718 RepID=A0ABV6KYL7_9SPHI
MILLIFSRYRIFKISQKYIVCCGLKCIAVIILITHSCFAQVGDLKISDVTIHQKISKVYLHFDRDNYAPGDTVWFKAYIVEGGNRKAVSKNFYLEVYTGDRRMQQRLTAPIFESTASGSIILPANSDLKDVYCRAYTAELLKETAGNGFVKRIAITHDSPKNTQDSTIANPHFLPEGGDWINGLPSLVAFSFTDNNDMPVNISGVVKCEDKVLVNFETHHDGMGSMTMIPEAGKDYIAEWKTADGVQHSAMLPQRKEQGVAIHVNDVKDGKKFFVYRTKSVEENNKDLAIIATIEGEPVYEAKINLAQNEAANGVIPLKGLPTGIMEIKLLNANRIPIAGRLTFVNNMNYAFEVDTQFITIDKRKRGLNKIRLSVKDTLRSNISVSVSDYNWCNHSSWSDNIISSLLLTGDLRGKIINPYYYFLSSSEKVSGELDLVMLTHGWRKYDWADTVQKQKISSLIDHNYLTINGKVSTGAKSPNGFSEVNMNVIVQAADSSSVLVPLKMDRSGAFFKDGLIFYGDAKLYFRLPDKSIQAALYQVPLSNGLIDSVQYLNYEPQNEQSQLADSNRNLSAIPVEYRSHGNVKALKEVKVTAKAITENQKVDETYTSGLFSGGISRNFNIGNDKRALIFVSLFQYFLGKIPGLEISNAISLNPTVQWRNIPVTFFLNNQRSSAYDIRNISMAEFAYVKVYDPAMGGIFGAYGGVIAVYTKKGKGYDFNNRDDQYVTLRGYTPVMTFYSPQYATVVNLEVPDTRKTLYWNPNIIFDGKTKEYIIQFYNNDLAKKFKLVVEGLSSNGKLTHIEKVF